MVLHTRIPALFGAQGMTLAPWLILIHPNRRGDKALLAHEGEHARQMRQVGTFKWLALYLVNREFRMDQEVAAYKVQIQHGASLEGCARNLATLYRLDLDLVDARSLLA